MAEIRQRKADLDNKDTPLVVDTQRVIPPAEKASVCKSMCKWFFLVVLLLLTASYLITETFTFNHTLPSVQKMLPRDLKTMTLEELKEFDGSDPEKPLYLAVMGKVFDVSAGRSYYGPGGSYGHFAGRDASRAYYTGCFTKHLTHDLRGLDEKAIKAIEGWASFYESHRKYFQVGVLDLPVIDPTSPLPEACNSAPKPK